MDRERPVEEKGTRGERGESEEGGNIGLGSRPPGKNTDERLIRCNVSQDTVYSSRGLRGGGLRRTLTLCVSSIPFSLIPGIPFLPLYFLIDKNTRQFVTLPESGCWRE